jgi:galactokinase
VNPPARAAGEFLRLHERAPDGVWSAPGRVNLIGEHTDYNEGFVLPFAMPFRIAVAAAARRDGVLAITTIGNDGVPQHSGPVAINALEPGAVTGWAAYPCGVAWVLRDRELAAGADLLITGNVPAGAGLSSSHALQCATALALLGLAGIEPTGTAGAPSRSDVAAWVQRSENDFVGVPTGLLDQTASLCCTESHVLFLDVRSGVMEQVRFDPGAAGLGLLVVDTRTRHKHAESGYRVRRAGCAQAAGLLGVRALRDVDLDGLPAAMARLPPEFQPLVRHVVTENDRVLRTVHCLRAGELARIGDLLTGSHASLRKDYRVSCAELDLTVDAALDAGALGARMTGGGFGGSAIVLAPTTERDTVRHAVGSAFARHALAAPKVFTVVPAAGAGRDL